jgi:signal transduction histidine kinase
MKLFYKFLLAMILISTIPLAIYSVIMLNTLGTTLTQVINKNYLNTMENITRETNKYFTELDSSFYIARTMERQKTMTTAQRSKLIFDKLLSTETFLGVYLLDSNFKTIAGLSEAGIDAGVSLDKDALLSAEKNKEVELGKIVNDPKLGAYFDVVYPIDVEPKEYVYYRARLDNLLDKIKVYLNPENKKNYKDLFVIGRGLSFVEANKDAGLALSPLELEKYPKAKMNAVFKDHGNIVITAQTGGPEWLIVFKEPAGRAYADITKMRLISIALIILTFILAAFGAYELALSLSKPISKLMAGMEIVAGGNLDYQVPKVSNDELEKLATIFNGMTARLKKSQDDIKRSERLSAIGQMANILGHEIRNPLTAISNAVYMIKLLIKKMPEPDPKLLRNAIIVENEIQSTTKIINDMLDFSRTRPPVLSTVDLGEIVKGIVENIQFPQNVKLEMKLDEPSQVAIDVEEIKQVVRNIVNNAVDSMAGRPDGVVSLRLSRSAIPRGTGQVPAVCLEISDTGCGIPQENLNSIFEPFYSTKSKGTGLGLAVVKRIVQERHKGQIEISSKVGVGTTFFLKFPI